MSYKIEGKDIVISGFENGIADDPYKGIGDMRNVNFSSIPGEASVAFATIKSSLPSVSGNLAGVNTITGVIGLGSVGLVGTLANYQAVIFTGATLPTGITAGIVYYLGSVSFGTAKIYTRGDLAGASQVIPSDQGSGVMTYASVNMSQIKYYTNWTFTGNGIPFYQYFCVDSNGRVWVYDGTNSVWIFLRNTMVTPANQAYGNGLCVWHRYLFVWRSASLDYLPLTDIYDSSKWVYGWYSPTGSDGLPITNLGAPNTAFSHETIVGATDDVMYSCDGPWLQSWSVVSPSITFDPTNITTYTYNQKALALPTNDVAQCLAILGTNLLIGGVLNIVYSWDRTSIGFLPIYITESFVKKIVTANTNSYIFAGRRGRIYVTNGAQAQLYKEIPDHLSGIPEPYFTWGGAINDRNSLFFGVQATDNAGNAINQFGGLWVINLSDGSMCQLNRLSYGTYEGLASAIQSRYQNPPTVPYPGYSLFIGWVDGSANGGVDTYSGNPYTGGESYVDTDIIPIGTFINPFTPTQVEWKTSTPLVAGESVSLYYRLNLTEAYTLIGTTTLLQMSDMFQTNFQKAQWVQLRAVLTSTNTTPSYCRLTEIRIRELRK
jgi:hypothetical protein